MYLPVVIILAICIGGLALLIALRLLKNLQWVLAWLRGTTGLFFLLFAIGVAAVAVDLSDYDELLEDRPIASIRFEKKAGQQYTAKISYYIDKPPKEFTLHGDQWQIDARIVRWTGIFARLGAKPGFQLDRISGRYLVLEDERNKPRSVYSLNDTSGLVDVWHFMQRYDGFIPGIDSIYGSAAYLPMADKANFQLSLSQHGLSAKPVNEVAKSAIRLWQ